MEKKVFKVMAVKTQKHDFFIKAKDSEIARRYVRDILSKELDNYEFENMTDTFYATNANPKEIQTYEESENKIEL